MGGTSEQSQKGIAERDRTSGRQKWGAEGGRGTKAVSIKVILATQLLACHSSPSLFPH